MSWIWISRQNQVLESALHNLGVFEGILIGTYVGIEIVLSEQSTDETKYYNVDGLFLVSCLGYVDTLDLGNNKGDKLELPIENNWNKNWSPEWNGACLIEWYRDRIIRRLD